MAHGIRPKAHYMKYRAPWAVSPEPRKNMYYPYFVTYMLVGLAVSLLVFLWALRHGQFRDQERARYLPLHGEPETAPAERSLMGRIETYALVFLACAAFLAIVAVLGFALIRA